MHFLLLAALVLFVTPCFGAELPTPPVAITSQAVSAADYPPESVKAGEQGATTVRYVVLEDGTVGEVQVLTSSGYRRQLQPYRHLAPNGADVSV